MDYPHSITDAEKRKNGKHLTDIDRGTIQALNRDGMSLRKIAGHIGCSPSTVLNELRRGTPPRKSNRGRIPGYSAKHDSEVYRANRTRSRRKHRVIMCTTFVNWCIEMMRTKDWSIDACVGYAKLHKLFPKTEMVCTHTMYNAVWAELISITPTDLPEALKRKQRTEKRSREHKRKYGESIDSRDEITEKRIEFGHWEGDTVVGTRDGGGAATLTLIEKMT